MFTSCFRQDHGKAGSPATQFRIVNEDDTPRTEAALIISALWAAFDTAAGAPLGADIARLIEAIEADPDDDELWQQAQEYLRGRSG